MKGAGHVKMTASSTEQAYLQDLHFEEILREEWRSGPYEISRYYYESRNHIKYLKIHNYVLRVNFF